MAEHELTGTYCPYCGYPLKRRIDNGFTFCTNMNGLRCEYEVEPGGVQPLRWAWLYTVKQAFKRYFRWS